MKFKRKNIGSESFPIYAYEAKFNGRFCGTAFEKVRITNDKDTKWTIRVNVDFCKFAVIDYGYSTLKEAKSEALSWASRNNQHS